MTKGERIDDLVVVFALAALLALGGGSSPPSAPVTRAGVQAAALPESASLGRESLRLARAGTPRGVGVVSVGLMTRGRRGGIS